MGEERGKREEEREGAREERRNDGESRWENQEARREERGERSKDSRDQVKRDQRAERREILDETRKSRQAPMGSPAWSRSSPRPARPRTRRRQSSSGHRATCTGRCERKTLSMPRGGCLFGRARAFQRSSAAASWAGMVWHDGQLLGRGTKENDAALSTAAACHLFGAADIERTCLSHSGAPFEVAPGEATDRCRHLQRDGGCVRRQRLVFPLGVRQ